jgi:hypothetical protein
MHMYIYIPLAPLEQVARASGRNAFHAEVSFNLAKTVFYVLDIPRPVRNIVGTQPT